MKRLNGKSGCAVEVTLSVMGGTWKPIVLFHLLRGKKRFGELQRSIGGITQRMLTLQLRELEAAGIVERTVYAEVPPRVDYELTALGDSLEPVLLAMRDWGSTYRQSVQPGASVPNHNQADSLSTAAIATVPEKAESAVKASASQLPAVVAA